VTVLREQVRLDIGNVMMYRTSIQCLMVNRLPPVRRNKPRGSSRTFKNYLRACALSRIEELGDFELRIAKRIAECGLRIAE
jgi:hypothetical protein